jgi:hypothetical protein
VKPIAGVLIVAALYALHQDLWFWRDARPLVFGVLPIGLFYHAAYSLATSAVLLVLLRLLWPGHLERDAADPGPAEPADDRR